MDESDALLIIERGPAPATQIPLNVDQLTIGRGDDNDYVLADPEVSRRHIRLIRRNDGFAIEDIGSTNGTFVNGQRISHQTYLQDGDTIDLGDTVRLRYMWMGQPTSGPVYDLAEKPTQVFHQPIENTPIAPPASYQPEPVHSSYPTNYTSYLSAPAGETATAPPQYIADESPQRGRSFLIGCFVLIALLLVCAGTFLLLDAYDQGRLLYCGPLAPLFETLLGPVGFAPICP